MDKYAHIYQMRINKYHFAKNKYSYVLTIYGQIRTNLQRVATYELTI